MLTALNKEPSVSSTTGGFRWLVTQFVASVNDLTTVYVLLFIDTYTQGVPKVWDLSPIFKLCWFMIITNYLYDLLVLSKFYLNGNILT